MENAISASKSVIGFSAPLVIEEIGVELFKVVQAFRFASASGPVVDVPAKFETDLASVPKVFQSVVGKIGYWSQAAVVHDLLYYQHRSGNDTNLTRLQADRILLEGCRIKAIEYSVPDIARKDWLIFGGVRLGGAASWVTPGEKLLLEDEGDDTFLDQ